MNGQQAKKLRKIARGVCTSLGIPWKEYQVKHHTKSVSLRGGQRVRVPVQDVKLIDNCGRNFYHKMKHEFRHTPHNQKAHFFEVQESVNQGK